MSELTIYFADVCGLCHKAMNHFREREIPFTAKEIVYDAAADAFVDSENTREMFERVGAEVDFVPQIFVGGHHIAGWRTLEPMIDSGEFEALLRAEDIR